MLKIKRFCIWLLIGVLLVPPSFAAENFESGKTKIKWIDFTVPSGILKQALRLETVSREDPEGVQLDWIELLAVLAARNGGNFKKTTTGDLDKLADTLSNGQTIETLTEGLKYYNYYHTAYSAVLGGMTGEYETGTVQPDGTVGWETKYGLRAYAPLAKGYSFSHFDDFGSGRNYGYKRKHLGHDMMALTGTPVITAESGVVEELGWNQYGGWRIGIRSFDGLRYWYYAHLRQNRPYAEGLEKGNVVMAGDVIGYVGRTGYSVKENQNNIKQSHLHWGLQIVFDEEQKDGNNQIWINLYEITKLLSSRRSETVRNSETKEHTRLNPYRERIPENRFQLPEASGSEESEMTDGTAGQDLSIEGRDKRDTVSLPVLMYHSILKDPARHGKYTIYPAEFEEDIRWLCENGYQTIGVAELASYAETGTELPEKPVLLTFDDGHYNNIFYAEPILKKYGMKAVMFVVGAFCDKADAEGGTNPNFSYVCWQELSRMQESGLWEVQSHTYDLHCQKNGRVGVGRGRGESDEAYRQRLLEDTEKMNRRLTENSGVTPLAFAYPYGQMSETADEVLLETGCKITFSCADGLADIRRGDPSSLLRINRRLRSPGRSAQRLATNR